MYVIYVMEFHRVQNWITTENVKTIFLEKDVEALSYL